MKTIIATLIIATSFISTNAFACAGCLDIYPEITTMDQSVSDEILLQEPSLNDENTVSRLDNFTCTKENSFAIDKKANCTITIAAGKQYERLVKINLKDETALALFHQLSNLTVEQQISDYSDEETPRTGKRIVGVFKSSSPEYSTVSLPSIHYGTLSCPKVRNKTRCEMELNVLTVSILSAQ